jgi:anti-sigma regulatory factor (Ser/Thr protein kinase)/anti-anti-sigma regulatory factor
MSVRTPVTATIVVPSRFSSEQLPGFEKEIAERLESGVSLLQLDCAAIEYATSSHINALWLALRMCQAHEATLQLQSPTAQLIRVLQVMDIYDLFADKGLDRMAAGSPDKVPAADQSYSSSFAADLDSLRDALDQYLAWMQRMELSDVDMVELQTVFYEVVANIIEHAGLPETGTVGFTIVTTDDGMLMTFSDSGMEFDPSARAAAIDVEEAARSLKKRGYGLAMIRQLVDKMEYRRVDGRRNELTLTRKWHRRL